MAFKENYKDEIADRKYQIIDSKTGAVIYDDIKIERVDTPEQAGDKFGASILNSLSKRFNDLEAGREVVKLASMIDSVNEDGAHNGVAPYWSNMFRVKFKVDATDNLPVDNAVRVDGYRVFSHYVFANPAGNNFVDVRMPFDCTTLIFVTGINGNISSNNAYIISTSRLTNNIVRFTFNVAVIGNVQIEYLALFYE